MLKISKKQIIMAAKKNGVTLPFKMNPRGKFA